ncbi:MAG TPA: hypothetical protein VJG32_03565 [Anaerolineae bacterium]|nr:hypothetical protein [Anaerolineae bacterium]
MGARLDVLRAELLLTRNDLLATIATLAADDLARPTHNGYADVHDTLAHLASAESGRLLLTRACLLLYPLSVPHFVINGVNGFNVGMKKRRSIEALKRDLEAGRVKTWRWLDRLRERDLDRRLNDPIYGRRTLAEVIRLGHAGHERAHLDEIRRALNYLPKP